MFPFDDVIMLVKEATWKYFENPVGKSHLADIEYIYHTSIEIWRGENDETGWIRRFNSQSRL